jgi:hypothetical protein
MKLRLAGLRIKIRTHYISNTKKSYNHCDAQYLVLLQIITVNIKN